MKIEFFLQDNRIIRKDSTQKLNLAQNDITIHFINKGEPLPTKKIYVLLKTPDATYRHRLNENLELLKPPLQLAEHKFFKISLYYTVNEKRITTNELIIPLDRNGWLEYKKSNHHHQHYKREDCDDKCGEYYPDVFDFILDELKISINKIIIKEKNALGYHNDELVQIIPLPNWVTREELHDFFGDIVSDIELDEEMGDLLVTHKNIKTY